MFMAAHFLSELISLNSVYSSHITILEQTDSSAYKPKLRLFAKSMTPHSLYKFPYLVHNPNTTLQTFTSKYKLLE